MAYLASIHEASAVRHAIKANFLSPDESSLLVAKSNRVDVYAFAPDGLTLRSSCTIYGIIVALLKMRPEGSPTDHIFILTDRYDYLIVSWDPENQVIRNYKTAVEVADRFLRESPIGTKYIADPAGRMLGVYAYEGTFLALPIIQQAPADRKRRKKIGVTGDLEGQYPLKMQELAVKDIAFLCGTDQPMLAVLHGDNRRNPAELSTYNVVSVGGTWELQKWDDGTRVLEQEAEMLIPVPEPLGGVLVVGDNNISHLSVGKDGEAISRSSVRPMRFVAWGLIDSQRFLLSSESGMLALLFLDLDEGRKLQTIKLEMIGPASVATQLVYLDNGYVFVGSACGDSQLVKLSAEEPRCEIVQTFPSLGPTLDFQVISDSKLSSGEQQNLYSSGQTRIVTACGGFHAGRLRSVRSGVGLKDVAILGDMVGVTQLFPLSTVPISPFHDVHDTLVVSTISETRVFSFDEQGEVEELESFCGLALDEETLIVECLRGERLLQVTPSQIRIVDATGGMAYPNLVSESRIVAAYVSWDRLVCGFGNTAVVVYDLGENIDEIKEVSRRIFEREISCLFANSEHPDVCAAGFWTSAEAAPLHTPRDPAMVALLSLPSLETLAEEQVGGGLTVPRSIAIATLVEEHPPSLLVSMGDGELITFSTNDRWALSQRKTIALSTQTFTFHLIPRGSVLNVFTSSADPSLIYSDGGRVMYSAVTAENVSCMAPFNAQAFPGTVVLVSNNEVKISTIEMTRNSHYKTLRLGNVVRGIAHSEEHCAYGVVTVAEPLAPLGIHQIQTCFAKLIDARNFSVLDSYALEPNELVECIACAPLDSGKGLKSSRFLVGTGELPGAEVKAEDEGEVKAEGVGDECKKGRLVIFESTKDRKLLPIAEAKMEGAVKCIDMMGENIVIALNKTIEIYSYQFLADGKNPLVKLASYRCHSEPQDIGVFGHHIAVGDLMKGPQLLAYSSTPSPQLAEISRANGTQWSTAVDMIDENTVINADAEGNLSIWNRDIALLESDRERLTYLGGIRLGEMVNQIRRINSQAQNRLPNTILIPWAYLATVEGSIYFLAKISDEKTKLLLQLQSNLAQLVRGLGELSFDRWRGSFTAATATEAPFRVADGNFIQRFLELDDGEARQVVDGNGGGDMSPLDATVDEVRNLVESLQMFH